MKQEPFNPSISGARVLNPSALLKGYNFYEGKLIDISGNLIKQWQNKHLGIILPNGNYVAQKGYEEKKWGLYTWDDVPIWEKDEAIHHDLLLTPKNTLITFGKVMQKYKGRKVDFCTILEYDLQGNLLSTWSTWDNFEELKKNHPPTELERPKVFFIPEKSKRKSASPWGGFYDYYRLNSLQILPKTDLGESDARFQEGNWLISFRHGSMMFILDKDTKELVWKCIFGDVKDNIEGQHYPRMLKNGRILLLDNGRYRGWSRVIEINPTNYEILWEYKADNFFTLSEGCAQRLSNGNTLITESEKGHVFEITREGEKVWEFYHPQVQDETNSLHPESYGTRQWIYRMLRYEKDGIDSLLKQKAIKE